MEFLAWDEKIEKYSEYFSDNSEIPIFQFLSEDMTNVSDVGSTRNQDVLLCTLVRLNFIKTQPNFKHCKSSGFYETQRLSVCTPAPSNCYQDTFVNWICCFFLKKMPKIFGQKISSQPKK